MITRHLGIKIQEHLHSKNSNSAIRDHIELYRSCQEKQLDINNFEVIRKFKSEYKTKIQEALLLKNTILNSINSYMLKDLLFC